ncbi:hypothetical protein ABFA07_008707 [Porites harrisoni]
MKRYIIQRSVLIDSYLGVHILWRPFALITVIIIVGYSNKDVHPSHDNRVRSFAVHLPTYKDHGRSCVRSFCTRSRPSRRPRRRPLCPVLVRGRSQPPPPSLLCTRQGTSSWHQIWTLSVGIKTGW